MSSEDKAPLEPDLSVPEGTLDGSVWAQLLANAFEMAEIELEDSIVPDFDEFADIQLDDVDVDDVLVLVDDLIDNEDQGEDGLGTPDLDDDSDVLATYDDDLLAGELIDDAESFGGFDDIALDFDDSATDISSPFDDFE